MSMALRSQLKSKTDNTKLRIAITICKQNVVKFRSNGKARVLLQMVVIQAHNITKETKN